MTFIEMINYIIINVLGDNFALLSLHEINERVLNVTNWEKLFFDYSVITSLVVYFALFYFIYYVVMYLPYRLIKKLFN